MFSKAGWLATDLDDLKVTNGRFILSNSLDYQIEKLDSIAIFRNFIHLCFEAFNS